MMSLKSAVDGALKGLGLYKKYRAYRVWEVWDRVVGPRIAAVAQPERLDFDTLIVAVSDSMWLHQLNTLQGEFLDKLNGAVGKKVLNRIYFRLGNPRRPGFSEGTPGGKPSMPELDPVELEAIDEAVSQLRDDEGRALVKRIIAKSAALAKKGVNR